VTITRHGRPVARLVPAHAIVRERADAAAKTLPEVSEHSRFDGLSWKELRDEGRR
jgi:antitoxin (DNA-binding transcriptional repressor) of toxin-antitoxin stability system